MKKLVATLFVLALLVALAVPALAETMYVKKDCKVYQDPDTDSRVTLRLKKGHELNVTDYYDGFYECRYGWVQEKYLTYELTPDICSHKWGKWHVTKEPTCTEQGTRKRTCKLCGKVQKESIKKTGHSYGNWKVTEEATCTEEGTRVRTCKVCGHKEKQSYLADHEYGKWKVLKEATCTEKGVRQHTCKVCGHVEKKDIEMLPHDYEWSIIEAATDHSSGIRAQVCRVCGHTEQAQVYDPEGTLRRKDRGPEVQQMQQQLVDQGYLNAGGADGIFGGGTEKALMKFQTDQGLNPDGVGWPQTLKRLNHDFGPWETVKAMTRTTPGERVRTCKDCGYVQRETIESGEVIERGARGENVRCIQQILRQLGYDPGGVDGIYGPKLDKAFTEFDDAHGMEFEAGKVRPADVDALVSAWLAADETPMSLGNANTDVNLALTVNPSTDETSDSDVTTYNWSLTNLGREKCMFDALLLTYGKRPDFNQDDLVMVIDGEALKPNAANSITGSFKVARSWGEGNVNFAAMAVSDKTGVKWQSNVVSFEFATDDEPRTVAPQAYTIDVAHLEDGVYNVAFDRGDVMKGSSGIYMNGVHIFTEDWYDIVDINELKPGDTLVANGESFLVDSVEFGDLVLVNGGNDAGGATLTTEEDGNGYRYCGDDDISAYTEQGVTSLVVDPSVAYTDSSDIESDPVKADYDGFVDAMLAADNAIFDEYVTTVRIENGRVVEITRYYRP